MLLSGTLTQLPQVRKWSGKEATFPKVREKSRNFYQFESGKIDSLKKRQGKLNYFHTADLIPSRAGWNNWGHCNLNYIFPSSRMGRKNACKLRPEATTRSDILYLFGQGNIYFIRKKLVRKIWNVRPVATMTADHCKCTYSSRVSSFAKLSVSWNEHTQNTYYRDNLLPGWSSCEMGNFYLLPKAWL